MKSKSATDEKNYRDYKKLYRTILKKCEKEHYEQIFDNKSNSLKNLWKEINNLCSYKSNSKTNLSITKLVVNGKKSLKN